MGGGPHLSFASFGTFFILSFFFFFFVFFINFIPSYIEEEMNKCLAILKPG